ncbi:MAG: alpha/beta fold hydrolase [bacterium]|nr:alpha/beta fold hydrolase [bacterium]
MTDSGFLINESKQEQAKQTVILAHGAGAAMDTPFMETMAKGLAAEGYRVVRFEFPYMKEKRRTGKNKAPNPAKVLLQTWRDVIETFGPDGLVIGGKSMGGRMASMVADEMKVAGLVCLGYPFHPPGRPGKTRVEHLKELKTKTLILQGERDTFGTPEDVAGYELSNTIRVEWLPDGDHGFKTRKKSGITLEENMQKAVKVFTRFAGTLNPAP